MQCAVVHVGVKEKYPLQTGYFVAIGSSRVKTAADRYRRADYHNKHSDKLLVMSTSMTLNDHEP